MFEDEYEDETDQLESIGVLTEDHLFADELVKEHMEVKEFNKQSSYQKSLDYFSSTIAIYSFKIDDLTIFQLFDRKTELSSYSWLREPKMYSSHLLNLINRAETVANQQKNL